MTDTLRVDNPVLFAHPVRAMLNRNNKLEPVKIIGAGNIEGKSPCFGYVGTDLVTHWESQGQFTITEPSYMPDSQNALQVLLDTIGRVATTR